MQLNLKWVLVAETLLIIILLTAFILGYISIKSEKPALQETGLLSPRIYSGLLQPKSFLIVNYLPLRNSLESYIESNHLNVSVYVVNLRDGASTGINERATYPPASLSKLPMAILIADKVEDGTLKWDTLIPITSSDKNNQSGSLFKTDVQNLPLRVIFDTMLEESDNTAFNILNHYIDSSDYNYLVGDYFGYFRGPVQEKDNANAQIISPKSMYNIFSSLYLSTVLESQDSEHILDLLTNTAFDIKKVASLPDDVIVAQKFAAKYDSGNQFFHDCGIIYIQEMRVFYCVMTQGLSIEQGIKVTGFIVNTIYHYSRDTRTYLDELKKS